MNWAEQTTQTKNLRDDTNRRIQELGNKYYFIKTLFERMSLKRDDLFNIGKELENEYKYTKAVVHLQNQRRRMKEALYCWYCENFFWEISNNDPKVLGKLNQISKNMKAFDEIKSKFLQYTLKEMGIMNSNKCNNNDNIKNKKQNDAEYHYSYSKSIKTNDIVKKSLIKEKDDDEKKAFQDSILSEARTNEEIDVFNCYFQTPTLDNFNFEQI